jgi:methionine-rich copper-binding protein CopC
VRTPGRAAAALAGLVLGGTAATADAHAFLSRSEPRVGAAVHPAPAEVRLWFDQEVEPAFSTIQVTDAAGERVDDGEASIDPSNRRLLHVSLKPVGPGKYTVKWRVVSVDTHVTQGDFGFSVER